MENGRNISIYINLFGTRFDSKSKCQLQSNRKCCRLDIGIVIWVNLIQIKPCLYSWPLNLKKWESYVIFQFPLEAVLRNTYT